MMQTMTKSLEQYLKQRRQLCDDLEYCVTQDKDLLVTIIDEFVYNLSDKEVKEYEVLVGSILEG